jgi:hypothetical protein
LDEFLATIYAQCIKYLRSDTEYHALLHSRYNLADDTDSGECFQCNFIDAMIARIISKCQITDKNRYKVTAAVIHVGSAQLVVAAHNIGVPIDGNSMRMAPNKSTLIAIRDLGYTYPDDLLHHLLDRLTRLPRFVPYHIKYSPYAINTWLVQYVISSGCKITDDDFRIAVRQGERCIVDDMYHYGYIINENVIASCADVDAGMLKFLRGFLQL